MAVFCGQLGKSILRLGLVENEEQEGSLLSPNESSSLS